MKRLAIVSLSLALFALIAFLSEEAKELHKALPVDCNSSQGDWAVWTYNGRAESTQVYGTDTDK